MKEIRDINEDGWGDSNGKRWEDYDTIKCLDGQIIDMRKLLDDQDRAKAALSRLLPTLGGLIGRLNFIYSFRVATQATDGIHIICNPQFTYNLDLTGKCFVMAHEVMHCLLNHIRRGREDDHERSNIAADYECNITLVDMGVFKLETMKKIGAYVDTKYSNWGYEAIYKDCGSQTPKDSMSNKDQSKSGQNNQNSQSQSGQNSQNNQNNQSKSGQNNQNSQSQSGQSEQGNQNGQKKQAQSGQSEQDGRGGGSQGVVRPEDCTGPSQLRETPGTPGGIVDSQTGNDIAEMEGYDKDEKSDSTIDREWKDAAIKAANKLPGKGAGAMLRGKIENLYKTSTNWKKELRTIVGHSINMDDGRQAYANKNSLVSQNRIARTTKDKYDNISYLTVFIDTSGSMNQEQYVMCLREVYSVALMKKPMSIVVIQCDTKINDVAVYRSVKELERGFKTSSVKGGGGTELKPCWEYLKSDPKMKRIPSELVMVFTDGYLTQYKRDPRTMKNLCWVIIDNPAFNIENKETHTKVIYIKSEDVK